MPEMIINASGPQYGLVVNPDGSLNITGTVAVNGFTGSIMIGSVSAQVDSVYIQSGNQVEVYGSGTFIGSIVSMPNVSVSVGSESYIKGGSISLYGVGSVYIAGGSITSMPAVNVSVGSESYIKAGSVEVYNRVAGSIVNIPNITINSPETIGSYTGLYLGSKVYQGDRFGISGIVDANITNTSLQTLLGSTSVYNRIAGSIVDMPIVGVSGTLFQNILGSVQVNTGSVRAQSVQITSPWIVSGTSTIAGSAYVTGSINISTNVLPVSGTLFKDIAGSVFISNVVAISGVVGVEFSNDYVNVIQSGTDWVVSGNVWVTNRVAGSIVNMPIVGVSGTNFSEMIGSVRSQNIQITNPWITSGTATIAGSAYVTGSINIVTPVLGISGTKLGDIAGSVAITTNVLPVSGTLFHDIIGSVQINAGSVRAQVVQVTNPWVVSGTSTIAGSAYITGSVNIATTVLGVSGTNFQNILGSILFTNTLGSTAYVSIVSGTSYIDVTQTTTPWQIAGSIWSIPTISVTVGSEQWIKGGSIQTYSPLGSTFVLGSVYSTGSINIATALLPISGNVLVSGLVGLRNPETIGSFTGCVGSIWSMPNISVSTGSEVYIKGGSLEGVSQFAGSIWSMPAVSVTVGSEQWIKGGSIQTYSPLGSTFILGSVYTTGSIVISNSVNPGSVYVTNHDWYGGSEVYIKAGSIQTYSSLGSTFVNGSVYVTGSINIATTVLPVSGTLFQNMIGSVRSQSVQITNPWEVSGNVLVSGTIGINNPSSIGSWTGYVGSIWSMPNISVSTGSESWIKGGSIQTYTPLGSTYVLGSVYATGSVNISTNVLGVSGAYFPGSIWFGGIGSVVVSNLPAVGSFTGMGNGSMFWGGGVGSVVVSGLVSISGPSAIGSYTGMSNGSIWFGGGVGSVMISGITQIAGSIWSMPSVSVSAGSEMWIRGGSLEGVSQIAGSIWSMPAVSVTAGSESYIKAGSIQTYSPLGSTFVLGSVYVAGSIFFGGVGSVVVSNMPAIGSYTGMSNGSIFWGGGVGSFMLSGNYPGIGSFTGMSNGSIFWGGGVGSFVISGVPQILGSVVFATGHVGSVVISGTSIPPWRGIGSVLFAGGVGSVVISGAPSFWTGVGSVHIGTGIGSVYICGRNDDITENIGSPCFKTSILITSGGYSDTWKIGGAGSRLAIHGWHISTNLPGTIRILVSGTTNTAAVSPGLISEYFLYYASGATIEKTFSTPLIPAGAGSAIGFGTTSAGSTTVTIFGREVK